MRKEWNAVEILRHSRHDWLNKLQLLKGNLALDRLDRVNEIIEEIIIDSKNETKLTNLKATQLASLFMLSNWEGRYFSLEFEVLGDQQDLSDFDNEVTSWCSGFFTILNESIKPFAENHLVISIQLSKDDVRFIFDFSGTIEDNRKIETYLEGQRTDPLLKILDYEVHNDEMLVTTRLLV